MPTTRRTSFAAAHGGLVGRDGVRAKMRVYAGAEHPHVAQNPDVLDVRSMNKKNTRS